MIVQRTDLAALRGGVLLKALGRGLAIDGHRINGLAGGINTLEQRGVASGLDVEVVLANDGVAIGTFPLARGGNILGGFSVDLHIVNVQRPDVSQLLDLGRALLALGVGHVEVQLLHSALDGVPSGQPRSEVDISGDAEVRGVDDLVGARVVEDSLSVDAGLVGESAESGDVVVEGDVDLDSLGNQILEILELVELVLALDVLGVGDDHAGHESTERSDSVPLTDSENTGVDVSGTGLQSAVCVGDGASGVVVEVGLDVARDDTTESADQVVDLARGSASNSVGNTLIIASASLQPGGRVLLGDTYHTVDTDLVDSLVDAEEIDKVGPEGVLAGKPDLNILGLDELDNLNGGLVDVGHVLAVGVLPQERRGSNNDIHSVNSSLDGYPGIVHVASDVRQNLLTKVSQQPGAPSAVPVP
jgi:hypothetical protein